MIKCFQTLCGISLSRKWPLIWKVIVDWPTEEEHIKKTCFFKNEQLERYFQDIDMTNCYKLVRGTVAVLTYYYKHVYWIKSHMKWKGIRLLLYIVFKNMIRRNLKILTFLQISKNVLRDIYSSLAIQQNLKVHILNMQNS